MKSQLNMFAVIKLKKVKFSSKTGMEFHGIFNILG